LGIVSSAGRKILPLRDAAVEVARVLLDAGFESYFAGGCVRDRLLGGVPDDYDIATAARPEEVKRLFPRAHGVGESFGVMLVRYGGHEFEIATFRNDGEYADGRRPTEVRFTDAREDAFRRDFTINGIFEEPLLGWLVDFVGGEADIKCGVIRAIGEPDARFGEDHLRLLRGVRFAARFGFDIESRTAAAMRAHSPKLASIARERIGGELRRMLEHPTREQAIRCLVEQGLDTPALREPPVARTGLAPVKLAPVKLDPVKLDRVRAIGAAADGDPLETGLDDRTVPMSAVLAAWALDRHGPDVQDATIEDWRSALLLSNREASEALATLAAVRQGRGWGELTVAGRKRWAAHPMSPWAQAILGAEAVELGDRIRSWRRTTDPASVAPSPLVAGDDLIAAGFTPGPRFRAWLDAAYDAQLEGRIDSTAAGIAMIRQIAQSDLVDPRA
jgi:poly(A) polymerase